MNDLNLNVSQARPKLTNKLKNSGFTEEELIAQQKALFQQAREKKTEEQTEVKANGNGEHGEGHEADEKMRDVEEIEMETGAV